MTLDNAINKEAVVVTYCNRGVTGNAAQNILLNKGFKTFSKLKATQK